MNIITHNKGGIFVRWKQDMNVGIEELDKRLPIMIDRVNDCLRMIMANKNSGSIRPHVRELRMHLVEFFTYQETMMTMSNYDRYYQHKSAHKTFLDKLEDELDCYMADSYSYSNSYIDNFISNWFIKHIFLDDRMFADYYTKHF